VVPTFFTVGTEGKILDYPGTSAPKCDLAQVFAAEQSLPKSPEYTTADHIDFHAKTASGDYPSR
jgi:hypothetical protein